ncbi:hypothetical protein KCP71_21675 [Salmonella enterica subsp. enterica]|nr:hypothetical protein KCP71_21675 [Salmonella enterica subsp. enterica]
MKKAVETAAESGRKRSASAQDRRKPRQNSRCDRNERRDTHVITVPDVTARAATIIVVTVAERSSKMRKRAIPASRKRRKSENWR